MNPSVSASNTKNARCEAGILFLGGARDVSADIARGGSEGLACNRGSGLWDVGESFGLRHD